MSGPAVDRKRGRVLSDQTIPVKCLLLGEEERELSAGALAVRELGLGRNREGGPGLPARKREGVGFPGRGTAAVSTGLPTARSGLWRKAWPHSTLCHAEGSIPKAIGSQERVLNEEQCTPSWGLGGLIDSMPRAM